MTDEMMHAQMAAAYAAQRNIMKPHLPADLELLPPHLRTQLEHFMQARQYTSATSSFNYPFEVLRLMLQITAVGNLAADPELKTVGDREVANFTLMVNKKVKRGRPYNSPALCRMGSTRQGGRRLPNQRKPGHRHRTGLHRNV